MKNQVNTLLKDAIKHFAMVLPAPSIHLMSNADKGIQIDFNTNLDNVALEKIIMLQKTNKADYIDIFPNLDNLAAGHVGISVQIGYHTTVNDKKK